MHLLPRSLTLAVLTCSMAFTCGHPKEDNPIRQTIEKTLPVGAAFSTPLPGDGDDIYAVTTAPAHAASQEIAGLVYTYTPVAGYVGDDRIVLAAIEDHKGGRGNKGSRGNCGRGGDNDETEAMVTILLHYQAEVALDAQRWAVAK